MGSRYYSGATQFSLKFMGRPDLDNLHHRSKSPFKSTENLAITAVSSRYPLPSTLTVILKPKCSILGPILVRNRSIWPTHAHLESNSWLLHGPCVFRLEKGTTKETWIWTKVTFLWFYQFLGMLIFFLLAHLESAYSLIWGSHEIWGKRWWGHLGTFMISRHI